jgi:6-phosphogluconolactonase
MDGGSLAIETRREVECFSDLADMLGVEAERVVARAVDAVARRGRFLFCLAGGATPKPLYELLASAPFTRSIEWPRVHVFWGDERCVRSDQPESNYRMAREALLDHVPLPQTNIHRIRGEDEPSEAAAAYENLLGDFFGNKKASITSSFDLVVLGMGADGHTASLFPGSTAAQETHRWVVATPGPQSGSWRVSLTPVVVNAAENVTFLVSGADKAERLKDVLEDEPPDRLPAQLIRPTHGALHWMIDEAAATRLRGDYVKRRTETGMTGRSQR